MASQTPMEDAIRQKARRVDAHLSFERVELTMLQVTGSLAPTALEIKNNSHLHAHHKAMQGSTSRETHFEVHITSDAFKAKPQLARHRMVYALLKDELAAEGGIHNLNLKTRTVEEEENAKAKAAAAAS